MTRRDVAWGVLSRAIVSLRMLGRYRAQRTPRESPA